MGPQACGDMEEGEIRVVGGGGTSRQKDKVETAQPHLQIGEMALHLVVAFGTLVPSVVRVPHRYLRVQDVPAHDDTRLGCVCRCVYQCIGLSDLGEGVHLLGQLFEMGWFDVCMLRVLHHTPWVSLDR